MRNAIRNLAVAGALGALAVPSLAVNLQFNYQGSRAGTNPYSVSAAPTAGLDFSSSAVSGLSYTYTITGSAVSGTGEVDFKGGVAPLFFTLSGITNAASGIQAGTVLYSNAALTTQVGTGAFSSSFIDTTSSTVQGQFVGTTQAVPEPASMAAMALGVTGLLARRKKGAR